MSTWVVAASWSLQCLPPTLELIIPPMRDNVRSEVLATQTLISHLLYYTEEKAQT